MQMFLDKSVLFRSVFELDMSGSMARLSLQSHHVIRSANSGLSYEELEEMFHSFLTDKPISCWVTKVIL